MVPIRCAACLTATLGYCSASIKYAIKGPKGRPDVGDSPGPDCPYVQLDEMKAEAERLRNALGAAIDGLMSGGCAYCQQNTARALDIVYEHAPEMTDRVTADLKSKAEEEQT